LREVFGNNRRVLAESELDRSLAGGEAFGRETYIAATASEANFERAAGVGFKEHAAVRIGNGDGVSEHAAEDFIERELGVKKSRGFEEAIEIAEAATRGLGTGDVLDARKEIGNGFLAAGGARAVHDFVGVFETEADGVAVVEGTAFDFFAVDKKAAALATVFEVDVAGFGDQSGAIAGDAAVGKLKVIAGFGAAADEKRSLRDADIAASAVRRNDFENRAAEGGRSCVRHVSFVTGL
jgi:hypothetical protein